jgi:hypothetical protein
MVRIRTMGLALLLAATAAGSAGQPLAKAARSETPPKCSANTDILVLDTRQFAIGTSYLGQVSYVFFPGTDQITAIIDLTGCKEADIVVEYQGAPQSWTVDLGDSPGNDGFGGDDGTTVDDAELQILNDKLGVYSSGGIVDNLATEGVQLANGSIKFVVKNQYVSWGGAAETLQTPGLKVLYAIPDPTVPAADANKIYLGIDRVILCPPPPSCPRTGHGVARVMITMR